MQLNKCGNVLISSDHRLYVFECFYCDAIHTEWQFFIAHIKDIHNEQVKKLDVQQRLEENHMKPVAENEATANGNICNESEESYEKSINEEVSHGKADHSDADKTIETLKKEILATDASDIIHEKNQLVYEEATAYCNSEESVHEEYLDEDFEYSLESSQDMHQKHLLQSRENVTIDETNSNEEKVEDIKDFTMDKSDVKHIADVAVDINYPENLKTDTEDTQEDSKQDYFERTPESEVLAFIEILQEHVCLWCRKSRGIVAQQQRQRSLDIIQIQLNITPTAALDNLNYVLTWYKTQCMESQTEKSKYYDKYFEKCDFLKASQQTRARPTRSSNTNNNESFICAHCNKVFSKKKYLALHARRHAKAYAYECKLCDKRTVTSTDMTTHMRVHTGEKPYICEACGKSFKTCSVLNAHRRKHERPQFQCTRCPKVFFSNYELKNHTNAHLNKRDYRCEFCAKAFTSAKILYSHKLHTHSSQRKTFCKICQKCFIRFEYHMKSVHGVDETHAYADVEMGDVIVV